MKNPVGSIRGQVILRINGKDLNLGDISVAIDAKVLPRANSGADEVAIGLHADLEQVRSTIAELFRIGGDVQ